MLRLGLFMFLLTVALGVSARADSGNLSGPTGRWITAQHNAVIQIAPCGEDLCGQIVGLIPANPSDAMPTDWQGQPQCGLTIIQTAPAFDASGSPIWKGKVLDPRNGKVYDAQLALDASRNLKLHGYIGLPVFGQTQTWAPFSGRTLAGCRVTELQAANTKG